MNDLDMKQKDSLENERRSDNKEYLGFDLEHKLESV